MRHADLSKKANEGPVSPGDGMAGHDRVSTHVATVVTRAVVASIISACFFFGDWGVSAAEPWPDPALRWGVHLPPPRVVSVAATASGAYIPQVSDLAPDSSGVIIGDITWNFAIGERFGFFGEHTLMGMWWANVALLSPGHEVGLRFLCTDAMAFEAAYLGHRVDRAWVDDLDTRPGGVIDNGAEVAADWKFEPIRRFRIEARLVGRIFRVYNDTQGVTGLGLRLSFLPADGHALVVGAEALRVVRSLPRSGVEQVTLNVVGSAHWEWRMTDAVGLLLGAKISTNLMVGQVPMLELKRSMIDEPMALGTLGVYFHI